MKNTVLIVCTVVNVIVTLIALIYVFKVDVTWTGPLGDTFGGLVSPVVGCISIYLIYKTFVDQRKQLDDQKRTNEVQQEQHHVNRITDIIYLQLERINESIKSQSFLFYGLGINKEEKVQGYAGLYTLNETINQQLVFPMLNPAELSDKLEKLIVDNEAV